MRSFFISIGITIILLKINLSSDLYSEEFPSATTEFGVTMNWIPSGTFVMGSPKNEKHRESGEKQVKVKISEGFWIGVYEFRQSDWEKVFKMSFRDWVEQNLQDGPKHFHPDYPVYGIRYRDALMLLDEINQIKMRPPFDRRGWSFRFPTEAEWEYACRAGTTTPFHCGERLTGHDANFHSLAPYPMGLLSSLSRLTIDPIGHPTRVGQFQPNEFGLFDMHGNVEEICVDLSTGDTNTRVDPVRRHKKGTLTLPLNELNISVRGGSFNHHGSHCRSAQRNSIHPKYGYGLHVGGIRLVYGKSVPLFRPIDTIKKRVDSQVLGIRSKD